MTSSTLTPATLDRIAVREAIVVSADALFAAEGITPVKLERVAVDAEVTPAELRLVFRSKRQLVLAALRYRHQDWMRALVAAEAKFEEPRDQILTVFTHLEDCFADRKYRGCAFINGYGELGRLDAAVRELADDHLRDIERHIAALCAAAGLPGHLAPALTLLIQGAQVEAAIHGDVQPARSARTAAAMLMSIYEIDADSLF